MIFIFLVSSCPLILRLIFVFLVSLERVKAVVTASASAVHSARNSTMVAAATLTVTRLPLGLAATPHYIHEILGSWGLIRGGWYCRGVPRGVPKGALTPPPSPPKLTPAGLY